MDAKIKNRHRLKSKDIRHLLEEIHCSFPTISIRESSVVETGTLLDFGIVLIDGVVAFFKHEQQWLFTLEGLYTYQPKQKSVIVDMGAVSFVTNGADVMAAGIVEADATIASGDVVWIADSNHRKALAVGIALATGEEMVDQHQGKVIKNIHYVGDQLWKAIKQLSI